MYWAPVFILIITCGTCHMAQAYLTQPPSMSVSLGQNVELSCTGNSISYNWLSWYQQKPGNGPRLVAYDSARASGIPARFTSSKDSSARIAKLTITGAEAEDDADYYCATYETSGPTPFVFGPGTKLAVKTSAPKAPSVSLLPPSIDELTNKRTATLVCLLGNFFPRTATVAWKRDNNLVSVGILNSEIKADSGADYKMSSYLTLSEQDWKTYDQYTCEVSHESKVITQSLKRLDCLPS